MKYDKCPTVDDLLVESLSIDVKVNPETIDSDIEKGQKEVDSLRDAMDKNQLDFSAGKLDFNAVNDSIIKYLDRKTQLDYLRLASRMKQGDVKSSGAVQSEPAK